LEIIKIVEKSLAKASIVFSESSPVKPKCGVQNVF
jgi:hypothetical protein